MRAEGTNLTKKRKKVKKSTPDYILMGLIILVVAFGIVMVYSASFYYCTKKGWSPSYLAFKQLGVAMAGIGAMLFFTFIFDYHICTNRTLIRLFYVVSVVAALSVKFIGQEANGAKRWIALGPVQVQPSEFVKVAVVLMLTSYLVRNKTRINEIKVLAKAWLIVLIPAGIVVVFGDNLSSAIVIFGIGAIIIFTATPTRWYYVLGFIVGIVLIIGVRNLAQTTPKGEDPNIPGVKYVLKGYRLDRIRAWIDPFSDPQDDGYQAVQALYAIGSGGVFGVGLSHGVQKLDFMPEPYNDIIFAVICEELGLVGALLLMLAYAIIILRGMMVAVKAPDYTGTFIAVGITSMIGIQAIINVGVNTNTLPTTGMQLPLISYGGTALLVLLATLGLLLNVSRFSSVEKLS